MDKFTIFALLSIIVYLVGALPYMYDTIKGKVIIHPFSWGVWFILISVNLYGLYLNNSSNISIIPIIIRLSFILFGTILGIIYIKKIKINYFDYLCLSLALSSILILYIFGLNNAILFTILVEILIIMPTVKKIYNNPYSEDVLIWFTAMLSQIFLLLSLNEINFQNSAFWIYSIVENFSIMSFVIIRQKIYKVNYLNKVN